MTELNLMETYKTIRGYTLADAARELMKVLPPNAYTPVPGAGDFTDIDPAYLTQEATRIFGLCGTGWWYEYNPGIVEHWTEEKKSKQTGREYTAHEVVVPYLALYYSYIDQQGNVLESRAVISQGANGNENYGYALRGAVTNAIGSAFAKLCWQLLVYQGKLDHKNAGKLYAKQNESSRTGNDGSPTTTTAEVVGETTKDVSTSTAAPTTQASTDAVTAPKTETATNKTISEPDGGSNERMEKIKYGHAGQHIIPADIGVPLAGKTLATAKKDARFGKAIISYLSGKSPNKEGQVFEPGDDQHLKDLQAAALIIYEKDFASK